jgi:hypothetical protein
MPFVGRACFSVACVGTVLVAAGGCFPDPKGEFEDFKARTANLGPGDQPDSVDASIDTKPPETATESLYIGICTTALALKDPAQALRFYTKSKFLPDGTGGGKLSLVVKPMVGWSNGAYITPASVSQSETRGSELSVSDVPVASGAGRFTAQFGTLNLPAEANSISGRDAVIINTMLDGRFGDPEFCAMLGGHLTVPYEYDFVPKDNICLFIKVNEGDPVPVRDVTQFVCAL